MPPGGASRILVIKHGALGDILQVEGALRDIRLHHPESEIVALTTPVYRRLLERCPSVDRVSVDARAPTWRLDRMVALRRKLRAEGFGRVYDLQNSSRTAFYRRAVFAGTPWSGKAGASADDLAAMNGRTPLDGLAAQLRLAGVPVAHTPKPDLRWMAADVSGVLAEAGVVTPYVVLVPGSSAKHPQKRWPHYRALASALRERGFAVVTAPGPDELDHVADLPGTVLTGPRGFLDWFELAGLFLGAAFVVGNDTGPTHLAVHEGVKGLALFGPHTPPEKTGILGRNFAVIAVPDLAALDSSRVLQAVLQGLAPV